MLKFSLIFIKIIIAAFHRSLPTLRILPYSTSAYIGYNELRKREFLYSFAQVFSTQQQNKIFSSVVTLGVSLWKEFTSIYKSYVLHFICQKSYIKDYKLLISKMDSESLKMKQPFCIAVTFKVYLAWKLTVCFPNDSINSLCYCCCLTLKWLYHSKKAGTKMQECFIYRF